MQARNPFTQFQRDPLTGRFIPETKRNQFGGVDRRADRAEPAVLLRRLPGHAGHAGRIAAAVGADRGGARRRSQRVRREHLRSARPAQQFPGNRIPRPPVGAGAAHPRSDPDAERPGRDNGTRDNYVAPGSESFDENSINVRIDGRLSDKLNIFGRYSLGDFFRDGPTAFGQGGGQELVSLGGVSDVRNHSLAYGIDYTLSPTMLADFRFGFFHYKVNVLPFDFGTTPATDAGFPA